MVRWRTVRAKASGEAASFLISFIRSSVSPRDDSRASVLLPWARLVSFSFTHDMLDFALDRLVSCCSGCRVSCDAARPMRTTVRTCDMGFGRPLAHINDQGTSRAAPHRHAHGHGAHSTPSLEITVRNLVSAIARLAEVWRKRYSHHDARGQYSTPLAPWRLAG
mgnify:CR=1 FL=1